MTKVIMIKGNCLRKALNHSKEAEEKKIRKIRQACEDGIILSNFRYNPADQWKMAGLPVPPEFC